MNLLTVLLQETATAAQPAGGMFGGSMGMILMFVALFVIMYFFMIRPQQKKQKALQEARNSMKVGDRVVTAGGIHGRIKEIGETYFLIEISDNVKIKIEKSSVYATAAETEQK